MSAPTICFIPCCKSKKASGRLVGEGKGLTKEDLPNTWNLLLKGRNEMYKMVEESKNAYIDFSSPNTSAIYIYTGAFYDQLDPSHIIREIKEGHLKLFIISAWYGIVDAFESLHKYEAEMKKEIAGHWGDHRLNNVICDLILTMNHDNVYGFFAGEEHWSGSITKYRYFFSAGLEGALRSGLDVDLSGCFYNVSGHGVQAILGALGRTFADFLGSGLSKEFVSNIARNRRVDDDVIIGFDDLT